MTSIIVGRFSILTLGHQRLANLALEQADHLLVVIGSPTMDPVARTYFSYVDRLGAWKLFGEQLNNIFGEDRKCITCVPLPDFRDNYQWYHALNSLVEAIAQDEVSYWAGAEEAHWLNFAVNNSPFIHESQIKIIPRHKQFSGTNAITNIFSGNSFDQIRNYLWSTCGNKIGIHYYNIITSPEWQATMKQWQSAGLLPAEFVIPE